jgi:hypothetical protein
MTSVLTIFLGKLTFLILGKPITPKKAKSAEVQKIKKAISKNLNEAIEQEIRSRATGTPKVAVAKAKAKSPKVTATKKKAKKASPKKKK